MSADTKNALTDFDFSLALAQLAINSQMTYAWRAWKRRFNFCDKISIFKTWKDGKIIPSKVGFDATIAPIKISMNVPEGKFGQVKVMLPMTSATVTYFDEEAGGLTRYSFQDGSIAFISDLDRKPIDLEVLKQIAPDVYQAASDVIARSGLPDSVFSIEYLFLKFTEVDLLLANNNDIHLPADMPGAARDKILSSLNFLLQGELGDFMVGTVVRRNSKTSAPTFALTDFVFDVHANTQSPEASTLAYVGMLAGHGMPDVNIARAKLTDPWIRPSQLDGTEGTISGVMGISKRVFMDDYLIKTFSANLGLQPKAEGLKWTFADEKSAVRSTRDIIDRKWNSGRSYTFELGIVPGTATLSIAGTIKSHAHMDGYTLGARWHTEWMRAAGRKNLSGSVTLPGGGIGADFQLKAEAKHGFGDLIVDKDEVVGGAVVLNAFEDVFKDMSFIGSTTKERLDHQQEDLVEHLKKWLDEIFDHINVDLSQHAFIPPGGGTFTFQNPRFSQAGDLIFDVIYQAP
jgi:hypothetical protein